MTAVAITTPAEERADATTAPTINVRRTPIRQLSSGPDGSAMLARAVASGELIELRHATVAHSDPARWEVIDSAAQVYGLIEHEGVRPLIAREIAEDGTPVLVFAAAPARDLEVLLLNGPLPDHEVWAVAIGIARALSTMHLFGLAHERLCPSAVRVQDDGAPLLDFALLDVGARVSELDAACAPPERGREPLDASSDVYALGALLQVLVLGRAPLAQEALPSGAFQPLLKQLIVPLREARPTMQEVCKALEGMSRLAMRSVELSATRHSEPANSNLRRSADGGGGSGLQAGMRLGRFELVRKIGEGGMGEVFEAIDRASGERAALKVLRAGANTTAADLQRFRKEARILSQLRSPYVANLIEWNQDAGVDYMALEFVSGGDLAQWRKQQGGRVHEHEALGIIAEVCRGLGEAHARGIVHRDIKPQNIMIEEVSSTHNERGLRLKLCDFGIARALDSQSATMAFTEYGKVIGTPDFMAPEQATGAELTPATDVYALGVMLFLLIAGRLPFEVDDTIAMLVAHHSKPAPKLGEVCPDVSEASAALVDRMLSKSPVDRFADANVLLEAIESVLKGKPSNAEVHPIRPLAPPNKVVRHVFEFELEASAEALWPYVSNTDRMNHAVGLPAANYRRVVGALGVETYASNRVAGVSLRWREHPFEWIEGRRFGVLRAFDGGVMRWYTVEVELLPRPSGGTLLRYSMTVEPRHVIGKWMLGLEMRFKQKPALTRVFSRIDAHVRKLVPAVESNDPWESAPPLTAAQRQALTRGIERLSEDGVRPELLDALTKFCEQASDQQVAQLRPLAFARDRGLDSDALVDACLRGAHHGLFVLLWEVLCPLCRIPSDFAESLRALKDHGHCPSCNADFTLDFAQSLELVFRVSKDVRASELRTYCAGGPAFAPHVVAQMRMAPSERINLSLGLSAGSYKVRSPQLPYAYALHVSPAGRTQRGRVYFTSESMHEARRVLLAPGNQLIELENGLERELVVRVERSAPREDALTAARAACLPSFRKLFPGEVLANGRLVAVGRTAFMAAAIQAPRQLMQELGDARAFELMLELIERIEEAVIAEAGALVKSASGTVLCAFDSAAAAARAALALRTRLDAAGANAGPSVHLVVHQGPAVAATVDGRLDYFGQTLETTLDLCSFGSPRAVLLSGMVAEDPHVVADLSDNNYAIEALDVDAAQSGGAVRVSVRH